MCVLLWCVCRDYTSILVLLLVNTQGNHLAPWYFLVLVLKFPLPMKSLSTRPIGTSQIYIKSKIIYFQCSRLYLSCHSLRLWKLRDKALSSIKGYRSLVKTGYTQMLTSWWLWWKMIHMIVFFKIVSKLGDAQWLIKIKELKNMLKIKPNFLFSHTKFLYQSRQSRCRITSCIWCHAGCTESLTLAMSTVPS